MCMRVRVSARARVLLLQRAPERLFARNSLCLNHTYQIQPWLPQTPTMIIYSAILLLRLRHCLLKRNPHLENSQHDKVSTHTRKIEDFSRRPPRSSRDNQDLLYSMEESPEEVGETHPRSLESTTVQVAPRSPPTGFHFILL